MSNTDWLKDVKILLDDAYQLTVSNVNNMDADMTDLKDENASLRHRLAECEDGNGGENGDPVRIFHPDRNRWLWLTQLGEEEVNRRWQEGKGPDVQGVIVRLDLVNRDYGLDLLRRMRQVDGLLIGAYVRTPVHAAWGSSLPPYEADIADLIASTDAALKRADGSIIWRTPFDIDLNVQRMPLQTHAQITAKHLSKFDFDFALLDGLTSHIYTADPWRADWNEDGAPDYNQSTASAIGLAERDGLMAWLEYLRAFTGNLDLIGNGAGEPKWASLNERWGPNGEPMRWEFTGWPAVATPSFWFDYLEGFMTEDMSWPSYSGYRFDAQYPRISESIHMWAHEAMRWRAADKWVLLGGRFEQMGTEPEDADRLLQGLSLILDAGYIAPRRGLPSTTLGDPTGAAVSEGGQSIEGFKSNIGLYVWERQFTEGVNLEVDPRRGHEGAVYR